MLNNSKKTITRFLNKCSDIRNVIYGYEMGFHPQLLSMFMSLLLLLKRHKDIW